MTRLAVLADVHANLPALEAVVRDARRRGADRIIGAGDYLTSGPWPVEVLHVLRELGAWMIRGNADDYFLAYRAGNVPQAWSTSYQWAAMRWSYRELDDETLDFIAQLPAQRVVALDGAAPIRVVHGSPEGSAERLFPEKDPMALGWFRQAGLLPPTGDRHRLQSALERIDEPVLVCGHTHIPWVQSDGHSLVLNPGAVSLSFDRDVRAHYALLIWDGDRWQVEHRAVAYDLEAVRRGFRDRGLLREGGAFARAMLATVESGRNVIGHLFSHIDRLAAGEGLDEWTVVPDDLWERALSTFDWNAYRIGT